MSDKFRKGTRLPAAIDMGNAQMRVVLADSFADGSLQVRGIGEAPSAGMSEGKVVDIGKAAEALGAAIKEARLMAGGDPVGECLLAVADEYVRGETREGLAAVEEGAVDRRDIQTVLKVAEAGLRDPSLRVLSRIESGYAIDGRGGILQPLGMTGRLLAGDIHLVVAHQQSLENMERCFYRAAPRAGLRGFVFSGMAAAAATLNDDEKELGVCVVDIGAGATKAALYEGGLLRASAVVANASNYVHRDISEMHHVSLAQAEEIKREVGLRGRGDEFVRLPDVGDGSEKEISKAVLHDTMGSRMSEILDVAGGLMDERRANGGGALSAGVVFVGGGALLPGLAAFAQKKLEVGARVGEIRYRGEKKERVCAPRFAVAMGLLMRAAEARASAAQTAWGGAGSFFKRLFAN